MWTTREVEKRQGRTPISRELKTDCARQEKGREGAMQSARPLMPEEASAETEQGGRRDSKH